MRTRDPLLALLILPLLIGCYAAPQKVAQPRIQNRQIVVPAKSRGIDKAPVDPAARAVEEIRKQYKSEFAEAVLPEPGKEPLLLGPTANGKGFPKTLQSIRALDKQHGSRSKYHAQLTVLKGMIQLQTGDFRSASAMESDMIRAASLLSAPSDLNSGGLLARNFKPLAAGWSEIYKFHENLKARNAGKVFPFASTDFGKINAAADQINENLRRHAKENPQRMRDSESDLGGLHVAAIAAAFYARCAAQKRDGREKAALYQKGKDLIGLFLTDTEKNGAVKGMQTSQSISSSHQRYLHWYAWLSKKVPEVSNQKQKKRV
ncbi:MAG: hypothetical protein C4576_15880 [Desulfobacteraceae bacterium]|nr:MAG: hypothetical protein C4576_15880 [Desulfobacteraceae bacterium]